MLGAWGVGMGYRRYKGVVDPAFVDEINFCGWTGEGGGIEVNQNSMTKRQNTNRKFKKERITSQSQGIKGRIGLTMVI